jgi:hypothetical protein
MSKQQLEKVDTQKAQGLYGTDFYRWTQDTAELIRQRRFDELDLEHVAAEIQDMGLRDHREVRSRFIVLLVHLLKWQLQPERRGTASWLATIGGQRTELSLVLEDSPSLRRVPREQLPVIYRRGVQQAIKETGLPAKAFPADCPYSHEQILDDDFFPEGPLTPRA